MKTISIKQPWAWLICSFKGFGPINPKRIENRPTLKHVKGRLLVHAGQRFDMDGYKAVCEMAWKLCAKIDDKHLHWMFRDELPKPNEFNTGGVVGWADFTGQHVTESDDFWFVGPNGLIISDAGELPFFGCKGALSIFDVDYPASEVCQ